VTWARQSTAAQGLHPPYPSPAACHVARVCHTARVVTIAVANQKGGVGKSTTARALGAVLARGRRVLLVDFDPQASLTAMCGIQPDEGADVAAVIGGTHPGPRALADVLIDVSPGLALAPSSIALASCEIALTARLGREIVLRKALATVAEAFDVCVIDCPPSLGLLTINALAAADGVLIPTLPQVADLRGVALFMDTLGSIREINPGLQVIGILPTMHDARLSHHAEALATMHAAGLPVLGVTIGRSVRVAESAGAGQSVTDYAPDSTRAGEYRTLAGEIDQWLRRNPR
jgi:chromosome partitioning protein